MKWPDSTAEIKFSDANHRIHYPDPNPRIQLSDPKPRTQMLGLRRWHTIVCPKTGIQLSYAHVE